MAKSHCDHRLVLRNAAGKIIEDTPYDSFAAAKPEYDSRSEAIEFGQELALQHGARIIFKTRKI